VELGGVVVVVVVVVVVGCGCLDRSAFDLPTLLLPLSYDCKHCVNKVKSGRIISLPKQILSLFLSYSSIYIVFVIHTGLA